MMQGELCLKEGKEGKVALSRAGLLCVCLLLIWAGLLKSAQAYNSGFGSVAMIQGLAEIFLGLLLASGWRRDWIISVAWVLFCVFTGFMMNLVVRGEASCGCFGELDVPPALMLLVDGLIAVGLCWVLAQPRSNVQAS